MSDNVLAAIEGAHASEVEDRTASRLLVDLLKGDVGAALIEHLAEIRRRSEAQAKRDQAPKLWTDVVAELLPHGTHYRHPFLAADWRAAVKSEDAPDTLFVMSQPTPMATTAEVVSAVALAKGSWVIECDDSPAARDEVARVGRAFKLAGSDSLFCASFPVDHSAAQWVGKAPVSKPFAGFANFQACLDAATARGASEEDAREICGALQAEFDERTQARAKFLCRPPSATTLAILKREIPIYKTDDEHFVMGIVLEPEPFDGKGDAQQDVYSEKEVRVAAHKFMEDFRNLGFMHQAFINGTTKILESFLSPAEFSMGGVVVKKGTWLLAIRVMDDNLWTDIKAGKLTGFSIGGTAVRRPA